MLMQDDSIDKEGPGTDFLDDTSASCLHRVWGHTCVTNLKLEHLAILLL